jgi:hypothetical protein
MFDPKAPYFDEKGLEYENFAARLKGEGPIPHRRNRRIALVWTFNFYSAEEKCARAAEINRYYTRDFEPFAAPTRRRPQTTGATT